MPRLLYADPKMRRHASGQAFVQVGGKPFYLGKYRSQAAKLAYQAFLARWKAAGRPSRFTLDTEVTINALALAYWRECKGRLSRGELHPLKTALRMLRTLFGKEPAAEFNPRKLKLVRAAMIEKGWVRNSINKHVYRIRRTFRWGVTDEMVPGEVWHSLLALESLREGESEAQESDPVLSVPDQVIEATLPYLSPIVADMVRIQLLVGCRPDEICQLRPCDLDRSGDVWAYRPKQHKNKWRGKARVILIGPRAQVVLTPYLDTGSDEYCFSPTRSEAARRRLRHEKRKTPLSVGNRPGTNRKRSPKLLPGDRYHEPAYRRAITRACEIAFEMPKHLRKINRKALPEQKAKLRSEASEWRAKYCWSPNQLRHTAGTVIRRSHGVEAAQVILGHRELNTTEIYAERDLAKAADIVRQLG